MIIVEVVEITRLLENIWLPSLDLYDSIDVMIFQQILYNFGLSNLCQIHHKFSHFAKNCPTPQSLRKENKNLENVWLQSWNKKVVNSNLEARFKNMGGKSLQENHIASKAIVIQLKVKQANVITVPQVKIVGQMMSIFLLVMFCCNFLAKPWKMRLL